MTWAGKRGGEKDRMSGINRKKVLKAWPSIRDVGCMEGLGNRVRKKEACPLQHDRLGKLVIF